MTLLDHLANGFGSHYPHHTAEWNGLNYVIDRFSESYDKINEIDVDYIDQLYNIALEK